MILRLKLQAFVGEKKRCKGVRPGLKRQWLLHSNSNSLIIVRKIKTSSQNNIYHHVFCTPACLQWKQRWAPRCSTMTHWHNREQQDSKTLWTSPQEHSLFHLQNKLITLSSHRCKVTINTHETELLRETLPSDLHVVDVVTLYKSHIFTPSAA